MSMYVSQPCQRHESPKIRCYLRDRAVVTAAEKSDLGRGEGANSLICERYLLIPRLDGVRRGAGC